MIRAGIGFSSDIHSEKAALEAAATAYACCPDPCLTFLFTTDSYSQEKVLGIVKGKIGDSPLIGFCGGGIITARGVLPQGIGICTLQADAMKVKTTLQRNLSHNPRKAGIRAGEALLESGATGGTVFVFPDGFAPDIPEMLRGLYDTMGPRFRYIGGGAGDNLRFFRTFQFTEEGLESDSVAACVVDGIPIRTGIGHGWRPIKEPFVISSISGKRVLEIDGIPALEAYRQRFEGMTAEMFPHYGMEHPLGFPDIYGNYLIRDPISIEGESAINFIVEVPGNAVGYLMEGDRKALLDAARQVAENMKASLAAMDFVLCFNCISRYLLLKEKFDREIGVMSEIVGTSVPFLGALSFGEVGSWFDVPLIHNKTIALAAGGREAP